MFISRKETHDIRLLNVTDQMEIAPFKHDFTSVHDNQMNEKTRIEFVDFSLNSQYCLERD